MAKSNGRTQRPQRTSRNSPKANVETKAAPNDDVEAVEDLQAEPTNDLKDESLEGDMLDLDDSSDKSDVVADDADAADDVDADAAGAAGEKTAADDKATKKSTAKDSAAKKTVGTEKADPADTADSAETADDSTAEAKKTEKSEKLDKTAKSENDSKSGKKSENAKGESAKGSAAKGSSAKRTSRSGNPAKRPQGRKTASYTSQSGQQTIKPNPSWFLPVLIGLLIIGLIWLVTFYVSQGAFPVEAWGNWNILIGFAFFVAGLIMSTRWR